MVFVLMNRFLLSISYIPEQIERTYIIFKEFIILRALVEEIANSSVFIQHTNFSFSNGIHGILESKTRAGKDSSAVKSTR